MHKPLLVGYKHGEQNYRFFAEVLYSSFKNNQIKIRTFTNKFDIWILDKESNKLFELDEDSFKQLISRNSATAKSQKRNFLHWFPCGLTKKRFFSLTKTSSSTSSESSLSFEVYCASKNRNKLDAKFKESADKIYRNLRHLQRKTKKLGSKYKQFFLCKKKAREEAEKFATRNIKDKNLHKLFLESVNDSE